MARNKSPLPETPERNGAHVEAAAEAEDSGNVRSVVDRALNLLLVLEGAGQPMRLTDVAREAGIHKATTQRLLQVLERRRFVERDHGRYHIGIVALPLANAFLAANHLRRAALPVLQELAAATQDTVSLFERLGQNLVIIERIDGTQPLRYSLPIGHRLPLHLGAGKVLAAAMPQDELEELLNGLSEIRHASGKVLSRAQFLTQLEKVRRDGVSISVGERMPGTASISVPIITTDGQTVAAISLAWPVERHTQSQFARLTAEVQHAAHAIAERLSYGRGRRGLVNG
jgi:IclR family acetate operon transcriptional repressor